MQHKHKHKFKHELKLNVLVLYFTIVCYPKLSRHLKTFTLTNSNKSTMLESYQTFFMKN